MPNGWEKFFEQVDQQFSPYCVEYGSDKCPNCPSCPKASVMQQIDKALMEIPRETDK